MNSSSNPLTLLLRLSLWILLIASLPFVTACGGDDASPAQVGMYAPGSKTDDDIDRELKFDARVENYQADGKKLIVDVNQAFVSSPPGIQQRALSQWYSLWLAARTEANKKPDQGLVVVARHEGDDLARWTGDEGFKVIQHKKGGEGEATKSE